MLVSVCSVQDDDRSSFFAQNLELNVTTGPQLYPAVKLTLAAEGRPTRDSRNLFVNHLLHRVY